MGEPSCRATHRALRAAGLAPDGLTSLTRPSSFFALLEPRVVVPPLNVGRTPFGAHRGWLAVIAESPKLPDHSRCQDPFAA